ncbi:Qat anti-phage system QueC-like protein QatC [Stenotrophomonas sp.]|uniref:Qat anti-phage system QueC-like protein QatC n=1 Tax=Stenotrophomonas sp. TaxID=69392 RepID=UPI002896BEA2|nr:Qat anti-phage system QueC-like protein QatC [Stenotrophomonas sp.]
MSQTEIVLSWDGSRPADGVGDDALIVQLADRRRHPRFGLGQLVKAILRTGRRPSPQAFELALVALGVWLADTRLSRQQYSEDNWTRDIRLSIPVRDPERWQSCVPLLNRMLGTLSGDIWAINFRAAPPDMGAYIETVCVEESLDADAPAVALFSGGLDSFTGAIDAYGRETIPPIFVSQVDGGNSQTVDALVDLLSARTRRPVEVVRWAVSSRAADFGPEFSGHGELTMRARSFLFFAASVVVASAWGSARVLVPENGFISLNVPLDPWRLGALTTRTTHPYVIARFNDLLAAHGLQARLENPFQGKTKGEMLAQCHDPSLLWDGLDLTVSCSKPKFVRRYRAAFGTSHCGTCWPCLIRRAAIKHAFPARSDPTTYVTDALDHLTTEPGATGHVGRSLQYGLNMLRLPDEQLRWVLATVAPLTDVETQVEGLVACVRNGLREVADVVGLETPG